MKAMKISISLIILCVTLFFSANSFTASKILCPSAATIVQNYAVNYSDIIDFQNGEYEIANASYPSSMVFVIDLVPNNIGSALIFLSKVTAPYKKYARVMPSRKNTVYCTYLPYNPLPSVPNNSGVMWAEQLS